MAASAKNRNKNYFKSHLNLGQWPDFKINFTETSVGDPLPKLLNWLRSAEQNDL